MERCEHLQIGPHLQRLKITDAGLNVKLRLASEFELTALGVENHEAKLQDTRESGLKNECGSRYLMVNLKNKVNQWELGGQLSPGWLDCL
jgi:hypothetical protein